MNKVPLLLTSAMFLWCDCEVIMMVTFLYLLKSSLDWYSHLILRVQKKSLVVFLKFYAIKHQSRDGKYFPSQTLVSRIPFFPGKSIVNTPFPFSAGGFLRRCPVFSMNPTILIGYLLLSRKLVSVTDFSFLYPFFPGKSIANTPIPFSVVRRRFSSALSGFLNESDKLIGYVLLSSIR